MSIRKASVARQINNARRRLSRFKDRRARGPEAGEALIGAPLAEEFIRALDKKIKGEEALIARLSKKRAGLSGETLRACVFTEGTNGCEHQWKKRKKDWKESPGTGPVMEKLPKWQYSAQIKVCKKCGREELAGGTISVPGDPSNYFLPGLYRLEPDGSRGVLIA